MVHAFSFKKGQASPRTSHSQIRVNPLESHVTVTPSLSAPMLTRNTSMRGSGCLFAYLSSNLFFPVERVHIFNHFQKVCMPFLSKGCGSLFVSSAPSTGASQ